MQLSLGVAKATRGTGCCFGPPMFFSFLIIHYWESTLECDLRAATMLLQHFSSRLPRNWIWLRLQCNVIPSHPVPMDTVSWIQTYDARPSQSFNLYIYMYTYTYEKKRERFIYIDPDFQWFWRNFLPCGTIKLHQQPQTMNDPVFPATYNHKTTHEKHHQKKTEHLALSEHCE